MICLILSTCFSMTHFPSCKFAGKPKNVIIHAVHLYTPQFCNSVSFSKQSQCNIFTFQEESYILFSWLNFMFNGMYALGKTVIGFSLGLQYVLAPLSCIGLNLDMHSIVRDRLQEHIIMLEFSFPISHAINNHHTFVTSGLLKVL